MNDIKARNTLLVKQELEEMQGIMKSIMKYEYSSLILLGFNCYLILIVIEALNYIENEYKITIKYKYKNKLKSSRARIKPYDKSFVEMVKDIKKINKETFEYYSSICNPIVKESFPELIDNLGITLYCNRIIDNTFLDEIDNKKIIITNRKLDSNKTYEISMEVGKLIAIILKQINGKFQEIDININNCIETKDYNVYYTQNDLFKKTLDIDCSLLLLNILCSINYYKYIIRNFNISNSLKYRIAYIVFSRTFNNLKEITDTNYLTSIRVILDRYNCLNNKYFRNKMFHYDIYNDLTNKEFKGEEIYLGLINKYFNISEKEYMKIIDKYIDDISLVIEKTIIRN